MPKSSGLLTEEQMSKLEPLGSLETVTPRGSKYMLMLLFMGAYTILGVAFLAFAYSKYGQYLTSAELSIFGVVGLLSSWFVIRSVTGYFYFSTDSSGLRLCGVLSRRFLSWTDITGAVVQKTSLGYPYVVLDTLSGRIRVDPNNAGGRSVGDVIIASIWYNLKKIDRAGGMMLPVTALAYWEPIPDEVPLEMDWQGSNRIGNLVATVIVAVVMLALCLLMITQFLHNFMMTVYCGMITVGWVVIVKYGLLPDALRTAIKVSVREGYIEADLRFEKLYLPWSEVSSIEWSNYYFRIIAENPFREVRLPRKPGSKESEQLLLSIIRHLRTAGVAVGMPSVVASRK